MAISNWQLAIGMQPIYLAFLWHQHQPFYKDMARNFYVLPWVRLHAIKDYIGMLLVLKEFPEIRVNFDLVPSLVIQIEEYASGTAVDRSLHLTRKPADGLTEADCLYILDLFFAGPPRMIGMFPRYRELLEARDPKRQTAAEALRDFPAAALRDLQVWATLAWFHPLVVASDPALKELRSKGRDYTEADKAAMLQRQDEVIRRVLPLHRELADAGQIELATSPFYHPILPLLCNMESAREAMPGLPMPDQRTDFRPDAKAQLDRAMRKHERTFGRPPTGLWPAEGSVSMDILPLLEGRGLRWIATDELILARSNGTDLSRDSTASLLRPDDLYQPYAAPAYAGGGDLPAVVFRDRILSDAIGFEYHRGDERAGAKNFVSRVREAARRCQESHPLIAVILDGENPWDYYEEAGLPFLRELYGCIAREPAIVTAHLGDYVQAHPPKRKLDRLAAGSWVDGSFAVWIGTMEDRAAWSFVAQAREALVRRMQAGPPLDPRVLELAWEEIYVAEGSDWCWWLGEDRKSEQDYIFDDLFRRHVTNVYHLIGDPPPASLSKPIGKPALRAASKPPLHPAHALADSERGQAEPAGAKESPHEIPTMQRAKEMG